MSENAGTAAVVEKPASESTTAVPRSAAGLIDRTNKTVSINGAVFTYSDLPDDTKEYLGLFALRTKLQMHPEPSVVYAEFVKGNLPSVRSGSSARVRGLTEWQQAMVLAVLEMAKKEGVEMTMRSAEDRVRGLSLKEARELREDSTVKRHHAKIIGKTEAHSAHSALSSIVKAPQPQAAAA